MKICILQLFLGFLFLSCPVEAAKIIVENTLGFERKGEMVEVSTAQLKADFAKKTYVLKNERGEETPYQLSGERESPVLLFQADVPARSKAVYTLSEGQPAPVQAKTFARFVPERKDDFAWENDVAAFRMYGPALADEYPSNGVDIWMKRSEEPVIDRFYKDRLERNLSYHEDNGVGLDCYDVKHTMGAGGIAPYTSKLWIGDQFNRYHIVETGPLRCTFTFIYDTIRVEDSYYRETITITTDAGSLLNKAVVSYEGAARPMKVAGGILLLHDKDGVRFHDKGKQVIAFSEKAVSNKKVPQGRTFLGVYMPGAQGEASVTEGHCVLAMDYQVGTEFTYYFGGGWSKWKFPSDEDWFTAMARFSDAKQSPLKITVNL